METIDALDCTVIVIDDIRVYSWDSIMGFQRGMAPAKMSHFLRNVINEMNIWMRST
jgi:hypothetical protein